MKIIECRQGSPEWFQARAGIPTASEFKKIITPVRGELSKSCEDYIDELLAQRARIRPWTESEGYRSLAMMHGSKTEQEARQWCAMEWNCDIQEVGFCLADNGLYGASPDGLGKDFGLECKCPEESTQIHRWRQGGLPTEVKIQVHGGLLVTGLPCWRFVSYCPLKGLPAAFVVEVYPDAFTAQLGIALEEFAGKLAKARERLDALGGKS